MPLSTIAPALFFSAVSGEKFGISHGESTAAADGAAAMLLGVTFFVIGMVAAFAIGIFWRARKRDHSLEELAHRPRDASSIESREPPPTTAPRAEWERHPDWWKNLAE